MTVKCGHCSTAQRPVHHLNAREARFIHFTQARSSIAANNQRTNLDWTVPPAPGTRPAAVEQPPKWRFQTPESMVRDMRDGRYAVAPDVKYGDERDEYVFMRVSRPVSGKKRGALVIQTQHSDAYRPFLTFWPSGAITTSQYGPRLDQALLMVAADPFTALMKYAELKEVCGKCGKKLTDNRSRWYGIGPECEKRWPEVFNIVNETKGFFGG